MAVGETDREIGAGAAIAQGMEALAVQPFRAAAQVVVVRLPFGHGVVAVDPRRREDRIGEPRHRVMFRHVGKHLLGPGGAGIGDDIPVGVEIDDALQRRLIGDRVRLVGARDPGRVLARQQHRIVADHGEARGIFAEGPRHAVIQPARRAVEAAVRRKAIARQRNVLVGKDRHHDAGAGLVGVFRDPPDQRQRHHRRRDQQVLTLLQVQPDVNGDFGQPVQLDGIDGGGALEVGHLCQSLPLIAWLLAMTHLVRRKAPAMIERGAHQIFARFGCSERRMR